VPIEVRAVRRGLEMAIVIVELTKHLEGAAPPD
jgi:hypothetical protein